MFEIKWHTALRVPPPLFKCAPNVHHVFTCTPYSLVTPGWRYAHWHTSGNAAFTLWSQRKENKRQGKTLASSASRDNSGLQWQSYGCCQGDFPKQVILPPTKISLCGCSPFLFWLLLFRLLLKASMVAQMYSTTYIAKLSVACKVKKLRLVTLFSLIFSFCHIKPNEIIIKMMKPLFQYIIFIQSEVNMN